MISAKDKMIVNIKNIEVAKGNFKDLRGEIYVKHQAVIFNNPTDLDDYQLEMKQQGIIIEPTINR